MSSNASSPNADTFPEPGDYDGLDQRCFFTCTRPECKTGCAGK